MEKKINSVQNWIYIKEIYNNGIIKLKNDSYVKILKILPINFNLKTDFEKEQILNSYKIFLKTCNFDIQILIQSKKEDLSKNIKNIQENLKKENKNIIKIGNNYINYIKKINKENYSSSKNFFILINNSNTNLKNINNEEIILGTEDKHLTFHISIYCSKNYNKRQSVSLTTIVKYNNLLGKIYFYIIWIFHRIVVKYLFKRAIRRWYKQRRVLIK